MGLIGKWNWKRKKYEEHMIQDNWEIAFYKENMDEVVNCCQCGAAVKYGKTYTSLEVHNHIGLGFAVCEKCYIEEWNRRRESEKEENE